MIHQIIKTKGERKEKLNAPKRKKERKKEKLSISDNSRAKIDCFKPKA